MVDSLTVEISKTPGQTFHRKAMKYGDCSNDWMEHRLIRKCRSSLKIQTHAILLDTSFNSQNTVLSTVYENFVESAMKYYRYAKSMGSRKQPAASILIRKLLHFYSLMRLPSVGVADFCCSQVNTCLYRNYP